MAPEQAGGKAYGLLYRALEKTKLVALAQFAMHSREHVVAIRPGKKGCWRTRCIMCRRCAPSRSLRPIRTR